MSEGDAHPGIRPADENDVEFLLSVLFLADESLFRAQDDWDEEVFRQQSQVRTVDEVTGKIDNSTTYVIEVDGAGAGRLRVVRPGHEVYVAGIQILPQHQNRGIGSEVLRSVAQEAINGGLPLTLHVEKRNPDAKRLYERLGFKVLDDEGSKMRLGICFPDANRRR